MDEIKSETGAWGARLNIDSFWPRSKKVAGEDGYPSWAHKWQVDDWHKSGLAVWDESSHKLEHLGGQAAIHLLDTLRKSKSWQTEGVAIVRPGAVIKLDEGASESKERNRAKRHKADKPADKSPKGWSWIEIMRLPPDAGKPLLALLERNEKALLELAKHEKEESEKALADVYCLLLQGVQRSKGTKVDLSGRAFIWHWDEPKSVFVCDAPPNRATVRLGKDEIFWSVDLERPGRPILTGGIYVEPDQALDLAEQWLSDFAKPPPEKSPRKTSAEWAAELRKVYGKRWIQPQRIDQVKPAYAIILELYHSPLNGRIETISFGDTRLVGDQYPSPRQLEQELQLPQGQFEITQPIGTDDDWYLATSMTTFYKKSTAECEAQRIWVESLVASQCHDGKVVRARYGIVEKGIHYRIWVGECGKPCEHWSKTESRRDHLLDMAVSATLVATLDLARFRQYLGVEPDTISDAALLEILHRRRSRLDFISMNDRAESAAWLVKHENQPRVDRTRKAGGKSSRRS